jgi:hypothetical protein
METTCAASNKTASRGVARQQLRSAIRRSDLNITSTEDRQEGSAMSDAYVYYFMGWEDATGKNELSKRPATLEAIRGKGEPIMESQIVVDDSELDGSGYFNARVGRDSYSVDDLSAQIWSLEVRAASRDLEASKLNDSTEGKHKYRLRLESRELRGQAQQLKSRCSELSAIYSEAGDSFH